MTKGELITELMKMFVERFGSSEQKLHLCVMGIEKVRYNNFVNGFEYFVDGVWKNENPTLNDKVGLYVFSDVLRVKLGTRIDYFIEDTF